jgi:hypothetical protein
MSRHPFRLGRFVVDAMVFEILLCAEIPSPIKIALWRGYIFGRPAEFW